MLVTVIDFSKWIQRYEKSYDGDTITYRDASGNRQKGTNPRFGSISSALQSQGYISRDELRDIGRWKVQGDRIDWRLEKNQSHSVEMASATAFNASSDEDAVSKLTGLEGVGVPVASCILTMYDPTDYAVIDFRVLRALGAVRPGLIDSQHNYAEYTEFLDHFRDYSTQPETYGFYMDEVRRIAADEGLMPREVDMALWAFDAEM